MSHIGSRSSSPTGQLEATRRINYSAEKEMELAKQDIRKLEEQPRAQTESRKTNEETTKQLQRDNECLLNSNTCLQSTVALTNARLSKYDGMIRHW
jgi:uncharacterized protein (DUF3084 family)